MSNQSNTFKEFFKKLGKSQTVTDTIVVNQKQKTFEEFFEEYFSTDKPSE